MGEAITLRREDSAGLTVAVALHAGVVALLLLQPGPPPIPAIPQRMTVSLASEVSLKATAARPSPETRAAIAPTLSDQSVAPVEAVPIEAEPVETAAPRPQSPPPPPSVSRRSAAPAPDRSRSRPDRTPPQSAQSSPAPSPAPSPPPSPPSSPAPKKAEGSRIGDDFLAGQGSSTDTDETAAPAATFGRRERAALASAITRQLRPHWTAPTGVEAEMLRSLVTWQLKRDGSLAGRPSCRTIPGSVTPGNRPQAGLHCERAIRAVQLAAPFNLPEPFYNRWKQLEWEFNRRL